MPRNKILARLPAGEYRRLLPHLENISLDVTCVLHRPNELPQRVYFLGGGVCSIIHVTTDGSSVGVATVGSEGFIGLTAFFGGDLEPDEARVTVAGGDAQAMDSRVFRREMDLRGAFYDLINRYAQVFVACLIQSAACNALHSVTRRCARWLLEIHDRAGGSEVPLTQEALAALLGVRRPSVTLAVGALRRKRLIDYRHRRVVILDRPGLEAAACECYAVDKGYFSRLLS